MARQKIQIWLRVDQAECAVTALEYINARFAGHAAATDQPAIKLATRLARERAAEVSEVINAAITKSAA